VVLPGNRASQPGNHSNEECVRLEAPLQKGDTREEIKFLVIEKGLEFRRIQTATARIVFLHT